MSKAITLPADVRARAQIEIGGLLASFDRAGIERTELGCRSALDSAHETLHEYYSRRAESMPLRASVEVNVHNVLCEILLGVITRGVIFESLEACMTGAVASGGLLAASAGAPTYLVPLIEPYSELDGEHQFMSGMSSVLDLGLSAYYRTPTASMLRGLLRSSTEDLKKATTNGTQSEVYADLAFDPWTAEPDELLRLDGAPVRELVRATLRHNSETVMEFVRIFPASVREGFLVTGHVTTMPFSRLCDWYFSVAPLAASAASVRSKRRSVAELHARRSTPLPPEAFICQVEHGEIVGFEWAGRRNGAGQTHSNCPAGSALPPFSSQEARVMDVARSRDIKYNDDGILRHHRWMNTAEALLRVAGYVAPVMWRCQFEAHELCPELWDETA